MTPRIVLLVVMAIAFVAVAGTPGPTALEAALNDTILASRNDAAAQAGADSDSAALSADGRYLAFASAANSLDSAAMDTNGLSNIYRRDLQTGDTLLIDRIIASNTAATGGMAGKPTISADGNCVAWTSSHTGSTMVAGTVAPFNVFVRNVTAGTTVLVNRASGAAGTPSSNPAFEGFISANCGHVVFNCNSCNALTPGTNGSLNNEVYIRELNAPFGTQRVSLKDGQTDVLAATPNGTSGNPTVSADGRYVAFASQATDIEAGVTAAGQIYVRDRNTNATKAVSRNTAGTVGTDGFNQNPMISADGRFVTWDTNSEIVVPNSAFVDIALNLSVQGPVAGAVPVATGPTSGTCFNGIQCFLYANSISTPNAGTWACTAGCAGVGGLTTDTGMTINSQNGHGWIFGTPSLAPGVLPKAYNITINANNGANNGNINYTVNIVAPPANGPAFSPGMGTSYTYTQGQDGSFVVNGFPSDVVISCGTAGNPTFATTGGSNCGGALPTGITNSPTGSCGPTACNVQISGTPTAGVGLYPVTYRARLRNNNTVIRNISGGAANGLAANETRRVNKINGGNTDSAFASFSPSISADGRMVLFMSNATDLVAGASAVGHVFLRDVQASTTEIIDLQNATTVQSNGASFTNTNGGTGDPVPFSRAATLISSDYRYVAFASDGTNLVAPDAGGFRDVFRRQRLADAPVTATFTVNKDFVPDNALGSVTIHLACTNATAPGDTAATELAPAVFNVTGVGAGASCTATEVGTPVGYTKDETGCVAIAFVGGGTPSCTITNNLIPTTATLTVNKDFVPNSGTSVTFHVTCSGGTTVPADMPATEVVPAVFNLTTVPPGGTTCAATEVGTPAGYSKNEAGCAAVVIAAGGNGACTITNNALPTTGTFTVNKDFQPNNVAAVTFTLTCTGGASVAGPLGATEAAPAAFAVFNIPVGGTQCTATETPVPAGFVANNAGCINIALSGGGVASCTVINTPLPPTTGTFTVNKDFQPNNVTAVTFTLTCTGGASVAGSLGATEAAPAAFAVSNIPAGGTQCTATETPVPAGFVSNNAGCINIALSGGGVASCTVINTPLPPTATFTVNKDFIPNNAAVVTFSVACTGGAVAGAPLPASEAAPAVFNITSVPVGGTTCTATETPVPPGYLANLLACVNIVLAQGGVGSCTITNTLSAGSTSGGSTTGPTGQPTSPGTSTQSP